jgi:hypothetical protein
MYLDEAKARSESSGLIHPKDLIPCTSDEVRVLEDMLKLTLPSSYKEFLYWGGHSAGPLLRGSDCFWEHLLNIQQWAVELLEENNFPVRLPNDAFVFLMHQGYTFMFLRTTEGDNPPVYRYLEGTDQDSFAVVFSSLSDFLAAEIDFTIKILRKQS